MHGLMNETVLRLAQRTALLLESVWQDNLKEVQAITSPHYFRKLGAGNILADQESDRIDFDGLCIEINNTLNYHEKVYLLLLVQDCLLSKHDQPDFNKVLHGIFECLGIDTVLIPKFRGFFEQDNLLILGTSEYLLLSPQDSINNEMLEGRWIEDNVPRMSGNIALDRIQSPLLVMFVEQIRTYIIRCMNNPGKLFDQDEGYQCNFRLLHPGDELTIDGVTVLTFSDLKSRFLQITEKRELTYSIEHLQYTNSKGVKEIHAFSTRETTGQLIGIVGR